MSWLTVYERSFSSEEEADLFYDRLLKYRQGQYKSPLLMDVDRYDGLTVRVGVNEAALDAAAEAIERAYVPVDDWTKCSCGHAFIDHNKSHEEVPCLRCECEGFDRKE